jgi:hypothetical protein
MAEMSPLGALILRAMRLGCLLSGGFAALVIAIEVYKRGPGGFAALTRQDYSFFTVLGLILLASAYFYRSIGRELISGGDQGSSR